MISDGPLTIIQLINKINLLLYAVMGNKTAEKNAVVFIPGVMDRVNLKGHIAVLFIIVFEINRLKAPIHGEVYDNRDRMDTGTKRIVFVRKRIIKNHAGHL
jgi:hypothetical protein